MKEPSTSELVGRAMGRAAKAMRIRQNLNREPRWLSKDIARAGMEGWAIFGGIERIDDMSVFCEGDGEPIFVSDEDAEAFVRNSNDPFHKKAVRWLTWFEANKGKDQ
jgi:hypothetical protein